MIARALALALASSVALGAAACAEDTIVLARIAADDAGGGGGNPPTRCVTTNTAPGDCPQNSYCSTASCDVTVGQCALLPLDCDDHEQPVCGCDGITYFNDCLRSAAGIAASTPGPCDFNSARFCSTSTPCPAGTYCAQVYNPQFTGGTDCPRDFPGACWALPEQCPTSSPNPNRFDVCGGGAQCVDTCTAIKSAQPIHRARDCPAP